jgi:putative oxidoreductase
MAAIAAIIGRILLAVIFIVSGVTKLMTVSATETMITGAGLPGGLAIPVGLFELIAGVCLAIGLMTRLASLLLVAFVLVATLFFHMELGDPMQQAMALKNLAIAGGLLMVFAHSQLWYGWDRISRDRRGELATREADERAREAELRAARAEGAVAATGDGTVVEERPRRRKWF